MKGDFKISGLGKCKDCVLMNWDGGFSGERKIGSSVLNILNLRLYVYIQVEISSRH